MILIVKKDIIMIKENKQNQRLASFINKQNNSHKFPNFFRIKLLKGILYLDEHLNLD